MKELLTKLKQTILLLMAVILTFTTLSTKVVSADLTLTPTGDGDAFINGVPIEEITAYIDTKKIHRGNCTYSINMENVKEIPYKATPESNERRMLAYEYEQPELNQEVIVDGYVELIYPDAVIMKADGSRADIKVTLSDFIFNVYNVTGEPEYKYINLYDINNSQLTSSTTSSEYLVNDPDGSGHSTNTTKSINVKIEVVKNGEPVNANFYYGMRDIDLPHANDPSNNGENNYNSPFAESVELLRGFNDVYVTNDTLLVSDGNRISGTDKSNKAWESGFITLCNNSIEYIWRAGGRKVNTKLFESIPIHVVKDKAIGGGEIKRNTTGQETDEAVVFAKPTTNESFVARAHEGHKIKSVTIDGEDATPEDKLAEFNHSFDNIDKDHEIIVEFEPFKYKINYDGNGASNQMTSSNHTYDDETFMSKENYFVKDGYRFTGFKLEGRDELITSPEDFRSILVEMGDGAEITLVAQWEKIVHTSFVDIDTLEELAPTEEGKLEPKDIKDYALVETEEVEGDTIHKYRKIKTTWVDDKGNPLLPAKDGGHPLEVIAEYNFVETIIKENGDIEHIYHKPITQWVDTNGKHLLIEKEGTHPVRDITEYRFVKTETKDNGDTIHIYEKVAPVQPDTPSTPATPASPKKSEKRIVYVPVMTGIGE